MSPSRLRGYCVRPEARNTLVTVTADDGVLVGHAFASRWKYEGQQVCWVTQLVVHRDYREQGLATGLLTRLHRDDDGGGGGTVFGIMSSHPAALLALSRACAGQCIAEIPLAFARDHAAGILASTPTSYVRDAKLCGSLFSGDDKGKDGSGGEDGVVCAVDSHFFVDHKEPNEALARLRRDDRWPLGDLPEGHEFVLVFQRPSKPLAA